MTKSPGSLKLSVETCGIHRGYGGGIEERRQKEEVFLLISPNVANIFINMHRTIKIWEETFGIQQEIHHSIHLLHIDLIYYKMSRHDS